MPIEVDIDARRREIAEATLAVVREQGAQGVTIRSVAKVLGGSTTRVTNYLPSRNALLLNAMQHAFDTWDDQVGELIGDLPLGQRLKTMTSWMVSTDPSDPLFRQLLLELALRANGNEEVLSVLRADTNDEIEGLREEAEHSGAGDPAFVAEVLYLVARGFYLSAAQAPEQWSSEKAAAMMDRLVDALLPVGRALPSAR